MGKGIRLKKMKLKNKIIVNLVLILLSSAGASIIANILAYRLISEIPGKNTHFTLFILSTLLPIVFLILFTLLFSSALAKKLGRIMTDLITAAKKVQRHELDFTLNYAVEDEIGALFKAFEEMRVELKNSLIREWEIEKQRKDMVSAISHDLDTPLTVIQLSVEGLLSGLYENHEKLIRYLGNINKNAKLASAMLEEIKAASKLETPEFTLCGQPTDIEGYVRERADSYKLLAGQQIGFHLNFIDSRFKKENIILDPDKVSRVMDNIIANSLRHTPSDGVISLDVEVTDERIRFIVRDTGKGFDQKDLPNLFNMFYKGDSSRSHEKSHLGLGLYIAKLITEKHGGTIHAGNNTDVGAFVSFTIKPLTD